jgi:murein DD-endopeptidase MepM/ murein hydrolase activator NlpD
MRKNLLLFLMLTASYSAQNLKITGSYKTGSVMFGESENIESVYLDSTKLDVDEGSFFTFAFDRDDKREHLLKVKYKEGLVILKKITPKPAEYQIQRINNIQSKHINPPPSENERIVRERKISRQARAKVGEVKSAYVKNGITRPVKGGRISGVFGSQRILNGEPKNIHNGLDIAVPKGTPVYAMADGFVVLSADTFFYAGNNILIDHGQGLNSFYLHLNKKVVTEGEFVKKGQKIGEVGTTGRSTGPHLHWGVQWYNKRIDPALLLKAEYDNINKNRL